MTVTLYLAPAAAGKTAYLVAEARRLAQNLTHTPRVVVPTRLQARAWRRRLAEAGGALGVARRALEGPRVRADRD
jgi:hypothetical protein